MNNRAAVGVELRDEEQPQTSHSRSVVGRNRDHSAYTRHTSSRVFPAAAGIVAAEHYCSDTRSSVSSPALPSPQSDPCRSAAPSHGFEAPPVFHVERVARHSRSYTSSAPHSPPHTSGKLASSASFLVEARTTNRHPSKVEERKSPLVVYPRELNPALTSPSPLRPRPEPTERESEALSEVNDARSLPPSPQPRRPKPLPVAVSSSNNNNDPNLSGENQQVPSSQSEGVVAESPLPVAPVYSSVSAPNKCLTPSSSASSSHSLPASTQQRSPHLAEANRPSSASPSRPSTSVEEASLRAERAQQERENRRALVAVEHPLAATRVTLKLCAKALHRLRRAALISPRALRRLGVSTLRVHGSPTKLTPNYTKQLALSRDLPTTSGIINVRPETMDQQAMDANNRFTQQAQQHSMGMGTQMQQTVQPQQYLQQHPAGNQALGKHPMHAQYATQQQVQQAMHPGMMTMARVQPPLQQQQYSPSAEQLPRHLQPPPQLQQHMPLQNSNMAAAQTQLQQQQAQQLQFGQQLQMGGGGGTAESPLLANLLSNHATTNMSPHQQQPYAHAQQSLPQPQHPQQQFRYMHPSQMGMGQASSQPPLYHYSGQGPPYAHPSMGVPPYRGSAGGPQVPAQATTHQHPMAYSQQPPPQHVMTVGHQRPGSGGMAVPMQVMGQPPMQMHQPPAMVRVGSQSLHPSDAAPTEPTDQPPKKKKRITKKEKQKLEAEQKQREQEIQQQRQLQQSFPHQIPPPGSGQMAEYHQQQQRQQQLMQQHMALQQQYACHQRPSPQNLSAPFHQQTTPPAVSQQQYGSGPGFGSGASPAPYSMGGQPYPAPPPGSTNQQWQPPSTPTSEQKVLAEHHYQQHQQQYASHMRPHPTIQGAHFASTPNSSAPNPTAGTFYPAPQQHQQAVMAHSSGRMAAYAASQQQDSSFSSTSTPGGSGGGTPNATFTNTQQLQQAGFASPSTPQCQQHPLHQSADAVSSPMQQQQHQPPPQQRFTSKVRTPQSAAPQASQHQQQQYSADAESGGGGLDDLIASSGCDETDFDLDSIEPMRTGGPDPAQQPQATHPSHFTFHPAGAQAGLQQQQRMYPMQQLQRALPPQHPYAQHPPPPPYHHSMSMGHPPPPSAIDQMRRSDSSGTLHSAPGGQSAGSAPKPSTSHSKQQSRLGQQTRNSSRDSGSLAEDATIDEEEQWDQHSPQMGDMPASPSKISEHQQQNIRNSIDSVMSKLFGGEGGGKRGGKRGSRPGPGTTQRGRTKGSKASASSSASNPNESSAVMARTLATSGASDSSPHSISSNPAYLTPASSVVVHTQGGSQIPLHRTTVGGVGVFQHGVQQGAPAGGEQAEADSARIPPNSECKAESEGSVELTQTAEIAMVGEHALNSDRAQQHLVSVKSEGTNEQTASVNYSQLNGHLGESKPSSTASDEQTVEQTKHLSPRTISPSTTTPNSGDDADSGVVVVPNGDDRESGDVKKMEAASHPKGSEGGKITLSSLLRHSSASSTAMKTLIRRQCPERGCENENDARSLADDDPSKTEPSSAGETNRKSSSPSLVSSQSELWGGFNLPRPRPSHAAHHARCEEKDVSQSGYSSGMTRLPPPPPVATSAPPPVSMTTGPGDSPDTSTAAPRSY